MKPERWNEVERIFHKAVEAGEDRRGAVLEESCAGDEELRHEVESLLAQHKTDGSFMEKPAFEADPGTVRKPKVPLAAPPRPNLAGSLFGQYRIVEEIGVGGMGVVYKAEDTKLGRQAALKFLPQDLAADHLALQRFRREARAASALNHPNICTIYDIVEEPGPIFIAMEYLEGQTLASNIGGRALATDRITKIGMPIAEALGAAHAKGIIHCDIKPGNIFLTTTGLVKVLDFGVAKLLRTPDDPTAAVSLTKTDGVSGTLPYMSPEQLRGREVDARSDIYSLGVVLYEMSTGCRPYPGSQQSELIDAILNRPAPPPKNTNSNLPSKLEEIILKCLEKDPEDRYQTAREIAVDLRRMSVPSGTTTPVVAKKGTRKGRVVLLAAAGVVGLGIAAWLWPVPPPRVTATTQITHDGLQKCCMVTDGSRIYFDQFPTWAHPNLAQVSAAGGESSLISTTVRDPLILDISPDHSQLLVNSNANEGTPMWILPLPTGSRRRLGNLVAVEARWSPDGRQLVFTNGSDMYLANADGGEPRLLVSVKGSADALCFSPDGGRVRFTLHYGPATPSLWEINTNGSKLHQLLAGWHNPANECCGRWTPDGRYYVFQSGDKGDIFAVRESGGFFRRPSSVPAQMTNEALPYDQVISSADGRKLFAKVKQDRSEIVRYDAASKQFVPFLPGISASWAAFSRDGKWIAYSSVPDGALWRSRLDGSERLQLTFAPATTGSPSWSPDGTRIAYSARLPGKSGKIFLISSQGGSPEELSPEDANEGDPTWSADGTRIAFAHYSFSRNLNLEIAIVDIKTRQASTLASSKGLYSPRWSPDGRYLLAETYDQKEFLLYDFRTQKWSDWVTDPDGVAFPSWTGDSLYIYYDHMNADHPTCRRVMVGVNHPVDLFGLERLRRYIGPGAAWAGLAPDNARLFTRDLSTQEIYALDVDFP